MLAANPQLICFEQPRQQPDVFPRCSIQDREMRWAICHCPRCNIRMPIGAHSLQAHSCPPMPHLNPRTSSFLSSGHNVLSPLLLCMSDWIHLSWAGTNSIISSVVTNIHALCNPPTPVLIQRIVFLGLVGLSANMTVFDSQRYSVV